MPEQEGDGRTQSRNLRQREIDEDDFAAKNLDAEIGMDADQADRHDQSRPQQQQTIRHGTPAAASSAATFTSKRET